jgi:hypothetical protein
MIFFITIWIFVWVTLLFLHAIEKWKERKDSHYPRTLRPKSVKNILFFHEPAERNVFPGRGLNDFLRDNPPFPFTL